MKTIAITALCACIMTLAPLAIADEFEHSSVKTMGGDFLEESSDGKVYFTKFYAPWCGHCKRLAPTWGDLADEFADDKDVVIAHVDCTANQAVCSKAEIRGYPTLQTYFNGAMADSYKGSRELSALKKYVSDQKIKLLSETVA